MVSAIDDLKKLSPADRLKKLKELEESRRKEIEEAQKLIKESEEQIRIDEELKDIPIPQMRATDVSQLFTREEKDMFEAKKGTKIREQEETLEEAVAREAPKEEEERSARKNQIEEMRAQIYESRERLDDLARRQQQYGALNNEAREELYQTRRELREMNEQYAPRRLKEELMEAERKAEEMYKRKIGP